MPLFMLDKHQRPWTKKKLRRQTLRYSFLQNNTLNGEISNITLRKYTLTFTKQVKIRNLQIPNVI